MSYEKILEDYDVLGTKGCLPFKRRNNLLITVDEVYPQFGKFAFQFTQIAPEGLGIGTFNMDMLEIPADCNLESQQLLIWKATEPPKLHVPIWIFDVQEHLSYRDQFMYTYIYDHASSWAPLPSPDQDQPFRVAELFAGGFGGWKAAGSVIRQYCEVQSQFISVEHCLPTAIAFAITHKTGFIPGTEFLHAGSFDNKKNWIVLADVFDTRLRLPLATWAPHMITISAPCPPWSGAAHAPGLNSEDGQMLMKAILECRWYRPHMILIEQVLGFNHHPHKKRNHQDFASCRFSVDHAENFGLAGSDIHFTCEVVGAGYSGPFQSAVLSFAELAKDRTQPASVSENDLASRNGQSNCCHRTCQTGCIRCPICQEHAREIINRGIEITHLSSR